MTIRKQTCLGTSALLLSSISHAALAQEDAPITIALDPILVEGATVIVADGPMSTAHDPADLGTAPAQDGAEALRNVPGVTAGRMGGHGLELVIRGQQQNQLNVIDAGSFTYGACPNRMDPPTAMAAFNRADSIVIEKGYASVTHGPGGSGGTVILERKAPELEAEGPFSGEINTGLSSNGDDFDLGGRMTVDLGRGFYMQAAGALKTAENYKDGSGQTVRSSFDQRSAGVTLGYVGNGVDLAFDAEYDLAEDLLYPGAGMDSPFDETITYRLRGGVDMDAGALRRIEGVLYHSAVDHVMDNYSLRPVGAMVMRTPATSDTLGGKLEAHLSLGATEAKLGLDYQANTRDATVFAGMPGMIPMLEAENPARARFLIWPDVTIAQTGLYFEAETEMSEATRLKYGVRYDYVRAEADKAAVTPALGAAPNALYTAQYGTTFNTAREEHNLGGLLRLEHELDADTLIFAGLSRSVRTADATERAIARMGWVGNPDIDPEKHHQLDVGVQMDRGAWYLNANAYVDWVDDYILRDQFTVAGTTTYRNVNAQLAGVEIAAGWARDGWEIWGDATYTHGENTTDNRALAQIPPLQGQISLAYGQDLWRAGARVNWASEQDRIDPARDPGTTSGFATLDLFGSYEVSEFATLRAGVNNVTDETYANHLSRTNLFDPALAQVNEPGRTIYVSLDARF
ncbi:TonB-dependent receptor domain-containing protein [Roseovarius sp. MMSF_3281]|uniref:TonB-dependent receptor domain-containing protein n=1 Tax=Roseovarius sp. MMSF_3281 TaxID=3046694 RepID=UPI00273CFA22|nr:TonB-dependent receptor [Roseovarius sp. MMSF_3281]